MFTKLYYDTDCVRNHVIQSTGTGKYMLNTPGNGLNLPYMEDSNIRLQKWGANMTSNTINLENDLKGLTRKINRDNISKNSYIKNSVSVSTKQFPVEKCFVDETRHSNPAWLLRGIDNNRWDFPIVNPQANLDKHFQENIQTRILEKDYYNNNLFR
jgi:hypothetical protein